jgi:hypothetical protein
MGGKRGIQQRFQLAGYHCIYADWLWKELIDAIRHVGWIMAPSTLTKDLNIVDIAQTYNNDWKTSAT